MSAIAVLGSGKIPGENCTRFAQKSKRGLSATSGRAVDPQLGLLQNSCVRA